MLYLHDDQAFLIYFGDIFRSSMYMLDMGIIAGSEIGLLVKSGLFLTVFALIFSPIVGLTCIAIAGIMHFSPGDSLLFCLLGASASYIAVPAALKYALPQANPSLYFGMSLGLTFPINIIIGIPLYTFIAKLFF